MNIKTRRAFRATAAAVVACSLIGVQALTSAATADSTVTWSPGQSAPANTGLWSNTCPAANAEPANLHSPGDLAGDSSNIASTRALVVGPNDLPDAAWRYAPGANAEGGIVVGNLSSSSTSGLSIQVAGATTGRLLVMYTDASGRQYVGEQQVTTTTGWQVVSASTITWWKWYTPPLGQSYWAAPNSPLDFNGQPLTLTDFLSRFGSGNTLSAAWQLGCSGPFAIDHLKVTDSATGVTEYDLQNDASSTAANASAGTVAYPAHTTITSSTTTAAGAVTNGTVTLQTQSGGAWTNASLPQPPGSSFDVAPTSATTYRVQYSSDPTTPAAAASASSPVLVSVKPAMGLKTSRATMNVGNSATFTATFAPARAGITVTFQQRSGTSWQAIGSAVTNSSGVATLSKSRSASGLWTVRAWAGPQSGFEVSNAPAVSVKVYQPVSISAYRSVSSVYVGRYFRIYGTVTPHSSGIALQLQQYVGGRWIVVAYGHSGTRGAYSFSKLARSAGVASFRVVAGASGYRKYARSTTVKVTIVRPPVYIPPPPPPSGGGGGGGGSGIG